MKFYQEIFLFLLYTLQLKNVEGNLVQVEIPQGSLKGTVKKSWSQREFYSFTGIPYAKPPVGVLRFEPPAPLESWEGVLDATQYGSDCIQNNIYANILDVFGAEDCLYINVYTPKLPTTSSDPLPVMFFNHGGGWTAGSGSDEWYGPEFLMDEDVVLVTYNYRLGALGFFSTGDEVVPGNNGLKDQSLALKWTKQNINYFGGNSNKITIFGNSAGGGSTHYQMFSPLTRDLFQGAIVQSGTVFGPWALASVDYASNNKQQLAILLNCPHTSSRELVDCLKNKEASEIIMKTLKLQKWVQYDPVIPFRPVIEANVHGAYLVEKPEVTAKSGKLANVPVIFSITEDDGFFRAGHIFNNSLDQEFNEKYDEVAPYVFLYFEHKNLKKISEDVKSFYFKNKQLDRSTISNLSNVVTDTWFSYPLADSVDTQITYAKKPVYALLFNFRGMRSYADFYGDSSFNDVVCHSDELLSLFTTRRFGLYHEGADKRVVKNLIKLWTNFAKFGNPTPAPDENLPLWKPVLDSNFQWYYIDKKAHFYMIDNPYLDRVRFWKNIYKPTTKDEL